MYLILKNQLLVYELKKILNGKLILYLLLFCFVSVYGSAYYLNYAGEERPSELDKVSVYVEAYDIPEDATFDWVKDKINENCVVKDDIVWFNSVVTAYKEYGEHFSETEKYDEYLSEVIENSDILLAYSYSEDSYYYRNILRTQSMYAMLKGSKFKPVSSVQVDFLTNNKITDISLLIICIFIADIIIFIIMLIL